MLAGPVRVGGVQLHWLMQTLNSVLSSGEPEP